MNPNFLARLIGMLLICFWAGQVSLEWVLAEEEKDELADLRGRLEEFYVRWGPQKKTLTDEEAKLLEEAADAWSRGYPPGPGNANNSMIGTCLKIAIELKIPSIVERVKVVAFDPRQDRKRREFALGALARMKDPTCFDAFKRLALDVKEDLGLRGGVLHGITLLAQKESLAVLKEAALLEPDLFRKERRLDQHRIVELALIARDQARSWQERREALREMAGMGIPPDLSPYEEALMLFDDIRAAETDPERIQDLNEIQMSEEKSRAERSKLHKEQRQKQLQELALIARDQARSWRERKVALRAIAGMEIPPHYSYLEAQELFDDIRAAETDPERIRELTEIQKSEEKSRAEKTKLHKEQLQKQLQTGVK